jgi:hypothetical protein
MNEKLQEAAENTIITAVEGGIGYWSHVKDYSHKEGQVTVTVATNEQIEDAGYDFYTSDPDEATADYDPAKVEWVTITPASIVTAWRKVAENDHAGCINRYGNDSHIFCGGTSLKAKVIGLLTGSNDDYVDWEDSDSADNVFQLALFGKLVYG